MSTALLSFLSHDASGTQYANTICVHNEGTLGGPDATSYQDIVDAASAWLTTAYRACLPDLLTVDALRLTGVGADHGKQAFHTVGLAGTSAPVDGKLPKEMARIISWKTNQATRSGRGHIAIPSPRESTVIGSDGLFVNTGAWHAALIAFADACLAGHDWSDDGNGQHLSLRVWSRKLTESYDVTAYVLRQDPRWVESRQTAP